jgi:hypothetical protein
MLARFIDHEYVDPADMWMCGVVATLGIVKGQPFTPDATFRETLDRAARTAFGMSRAVGFEPGGVFTKHYQDRQWLNPFPGGSPGFTAPTFDQAALRSAFFSFAYSTSPGMAVNMVDVAAKYFTDAAGNFLSGSKSYKLRLPNGVTAKLFWSVTVYDTLTVESADYRRYAVECFRLLATMKDPESKASLIAMGQAWLSLAELSDGKRHR